MSIPTRSFPISLTLASLLAPLSAQEHRNVHFHTGGIHTLAVAAYPASFVRVKAVR